jgi:hypothetical protein
MNIPGRWLGLVAGVALLLPGAPVHAGFGIFKTRVSLARTRPPELPPQAESVAVRVEAGGPEIEGAHLDEVRRRLERALASGELYRVVAETRGADAVVRVTLGRLRGEVRDEVRSERRRVKIGERQEWNAKKQRWETKDVWGDREVLVPWRVAMGELRGELELEDLEGTRRRPIDARYEREFKKDDGYPFEAESEQALRDSLVALGADQAMGMIGFGPDPVEALLATNGPLKSGNKLLQEGRFEDARAEWERLRLRGDDEAARLHNLGVALEALAYRLPPFAPDHRERLEAARELYRQARSLDAGEKHFAAPLERIEVSLGYAADAWRLRTDLERVRQRPAKPAPPSPKPATPAPRGTPSPRPPAAGNGVGASGLRNGGFESALPPWTVSGKATLASEDEHGRVLELAHGTAPAQAEQVLALGLTQAKRAALSLEYRVVSGEGVLRVGVEYLDETGKARRATLEVTAGEAPGPWSSWTHDLLGLRPRPSRITRLRLTVAGGMLRLDDVDLQLDE